MNFRKLILIVIIFKSFNLLAQENLETGQHIYCDKLTYITLNENNEFEYLKYYNWSPLTVEEKRNTVNEKACGSVGYISGAKGTGKYEINDGILVLRFLDFKKYMDKTTDLNEETKTMEFIIKKFIN